MSFNQAGAIPRATIVEMIRQIPFLQDLPREEVAHILVDNTKQIDLPANQRFAEQGAEAEYLYYIVQGRVRLLREKRRPDGQSVQVLNRTIGPEELVGRFALIYDLPYTAQAHTETPSTLLRFETAALKRLLYRFPEMRATLAPQDVINRLRTIPLLAGVDLVTLSYLAEEVKVRTFAADDVVYTQDQPADSLYLIHQGQVELYHPRRPAEKMWLGTGAAFGFPGRTGAVGGLYDHWAAATTATTLYVLPGKSVQRVAQLYPRVADPAIQTVPVAALKKISVFNQFLPEEFNKLAGFCSFQHIPQHHLIMHQGDINDSMWILLEGGEAILSALEEGGRARPRTRVDGPVYFGETALRAQVHVNSTVEAEPGSCWLRLHWQDFRRFLAQEGTDLQRKLNIRLPEERRREILEGEQDYPWLDEGERLIAFRRRHLIALVPKLKPAYFALVIATVFVTILAATGISAIWLILASSLFLIPTIAWGLIDYWNDYLIVTNQRVVQQEKVIFFNEMRRVAPNEQIQRVDVDRAFWGNLLNYGTLSIFTAGSSTPIEFNYVEDPEELRRTIFRARSLRQQRYRAESKIEIQNSLEERLGLTVNLPSRVYAPSEPSPRDVEALPWWKRFWSYLRIGDQTQLQQERVVWRKHWFILARNLIVPLLITGLLLALMTGGLLTAAWVPQIFLGLEILLGILSLVSLAWMIWIVDDWANDTYELTRDRIIDIEKKPLFFSEKRLEAQLSEIQDIQFTVPSPLQMLLGYGDVRVQTAAREGAFTFDQVPRPQEVAEEIRRRQEEWMRQEERRRVRDQIRELPDWFELYSRLEANREPADRVSDSEPPDTTSGATNQS